MGSLGSVLLVALIIYLLCQAIAHYAKPPPAPPPPPPEPDPDKKTQEKIAIDILMGKTTPEGIQKDKNYDINHIKQWVADYTFYAVSYSVDSHKINSRIDLMEDDIAWFKNTCREYIGEDWEEKTDYKNRSRKKYK